MVLGSEVFDHEKVSPGQSRTDHALDLYLAPSTPKSGFDCYLIVRPLTYLP